MSGSSRRNPGTSAAASVWATGQHSGPAELAAGGYLPDTAGDAFRIPPTVARHAISLYTRPGDTVLDPDCGSGTVLVEALRTGRHAVGLTKQKRWWPLARANISAAKHDGALTDGMVLDSAPEQTPHNWQA
ncbi:DNA methyltransferase [Streptomyces sp. NPDC059479]|uniref:DNA methyltransferase n=1 Tax=Streptomyces sp. NPDC059479 TaxID=3346848 RepID=UPI0036B29DB1